MSLQSAFERHLPLIEAELRKALATPHPSLAPFYGMMRYHLGWVDEGFSPIEAKGGKRLRPLLCLLVCEAAGGNPEQALPAAVAVELVHNFSLVHDDIEDASPLRRHRPTVWRVWGVPQAINVGDALFALAQLALQGLAEQGIPPARALAAFEVLEGACLALTEGQYLDLNFEERLDVTVEEYLRMIRGKTAALLAACAHLGALVASDDTELLTHYRSFGENLGMTFQIVDDILGIWGEESVTGKPVADDIRQRKKSLPVVYALGLRAGKQGLREIYGKDKLTEEDVRRAMAILDEAGARRYAERLARDYHWRALAELEATGVENEAQADLRELADFLIERVY